MKLLLRLLVAVSVSQIAGVACASYVRSNIYKNHASKNYDHHTHQHHCRSCHRCNRSHNNLKRTSVGFGVSFTAPVYTPEVVVQKRYYAPEARVARTYSAPVFTQITTQKSTQTRTYRSYGPACSLYESRTTCFEPELEQTFIVEALPEESVLVQSAIVETAPVNTVSVYETVVEQPVVCVNRSRSRADKACSALNAISAGFNFASAMVDAFAD